MKLILKMNKFIVRTEELILMVCIIAMALVLIANVLCRLCLGFSLSFAEEVGQNLLVLVTFIGVSCCATSGKHINMLAIFDVMHLKVQKTAAFLISGLTSATMLILSYIAFEYMLMVKSVGRVTTALQFPVYLIVMMVALGFFFAGIQYLLIFIRNMMEKKVYISLDSHYEKDHC